jgi:hypothetical protein
LGVAQLADDSRAKRGTAVLVVVSPVVLDGRLDRGEGRSGGVPVVDQVEDAVEVGVRGRRRRTWCTRRALRLWFRFGDAGSWRDFPGAVGESEHRAGDAQSVGDPLDDVDVREPALPRHDLADPAGGHAA